MTRPPRILVWLDSAPARERAVQLLGDGPERSWSVVAVADIEALHREFADGVVDAVVLSANHFQSAQHLLSRPAAADAVVLWCAEPGDEVAEVATVAEGQFAARVHRLGSVSQLGAALPVAVDAHVRSHAAHRARELETAEVEQRCGMLESAERLTGAGGWSLLADEESLRCSPVFASLRDLSIEMAPRTLTEWMATVHEADRERVESALRVAFDLDEPPELRYRVLRAGGAVRIVRCLMQAVSANDRAGILLVGIEQDITEQQQAEDDRERLESQLRHSQKLEALGRFAAGAAHDFNNVLTTILGRVQLARVGLSGGAATIEQVGGHLESVESACRRATALTRHLLTIGRRENAEREILELHELLASHEVMLRRLVREDISLEVRYAAGRDTVELARDQFDQVLMNLVVNACDAMPNGGSIRIETSNLELAPGAPELAAGGRPGSYVRIAVCDSGVGIAAADLERVFEPFFTSKPRDKGTGLGLAIIQSICSGAGGFVSLTSHRGQGTCVSVHLPAVSERPPAQTPVEISRAAPSPRGDETILFCEDEDRVRESLAQTLRDRGYRVLEAQSAVDAISAAAEADEIDVLVSDVVLTGMSGPRLARTLLETRPEMRVLFVSGYAPDELSDEDASDIGAENLLEKPFSGEDLLRRIRRLLDARVVES